MEENFTQIKQDTMMCVFYASKKKSELPASYFVLTLGLSYPLESERVAVKTEPYPGR